MFVLFGLSACSSLQEKLAKRVACDPNKLIVTDQISVPAYREYKFTCEGRKYSCRNAPFHSSCEEVKGEQAPKK
jgi:hypothetical protein